MQRPFLVGEYDVILDAKNRIAVPARLRSAFDEGIYVTQEKERCLGGYSPGRFRERLDEDVAVTPAGTAARRDAKRRLAATAVFFPEFDRQGRVTLPLKHLEHAGIRKEVTVIGAADHVEIWDRATWVAYDERMREKEKEEADASADERSAS
jgi:MraZ protein